MQSSPSGCTSCRWPARFDCPLVGDGAAVVLTVITGLDYVYRALTLRQTSARAMKAAAARRAAGPSGARTDTAA